MPPNFLHYFETVKVTKGPRTVFPVKSSVIGLVGTAPIGPVQTQTVCLSDTRAAEFGPQIPCFTIPQALDAIYDHGYGAVIVINVLDPAVHKTTIPDEVVTLTGDYGFTEFPALVSYPVVKNLAGSTTYAKDTHYTIDLVRGKITRKGNTIAADASLKVTYDYADPSLVTANDIIGGVNGAGDRIGMQALLDSAQLLGYRAKLLIAPGYSPLASVASEMVIMAEKLKAMALLDAPVGTTFDGAISGRGPSGTINFYMSSFRAIACYPYLKANDPYAWDAGNTVWDGGVTMRLEPASQRLAGLIAKTDNEKGYWWSASNQEYSGVLGVEVKLTQETGDGSSETNALNEAGIVTVRNAWGTGYRAWGNRSTAWPVHTDPETFYAVQRTQDVFLEMVEMVCVNTFLDNPITQALLDAVVETVNAIIRNHIAQGALVGGKCLYDPNRNSSTGLAVGHIVFSLSLMPPPPAERITFEIFTDLSLLSTLGTANV